MRPNPVIAVPTYHLPGGQIGRWGTGGYALPTRYVECVVRAGGVPVLIPSRTDIDPAIVLASADGLLLPGGGDIDPARYRQTPHPSVYGVDPSRDAFETAALAEARRRGLPVLAICRGFQLTNVAGGGTLAQHLPDREALEPHGTPGGGTSAVHGVRVAPDSRLAAITGTTTTGRVERCTSWHHQGIDAVAPGLRAVGWTDDGLVEALEPADPASHWLVAVQWHPETTAETDPVQQALFDAFARACSAGSAGAQRDGEDDLDVSSAAQATTSRSEPVRS